jgi:hypothetical protein
VADNAHHSPEPTGHEHSKRQSGAEAEVIGELVMNPRMHDIRERQAVGALTGLPVAHLHQHDPEKKKASSDDQRFDSHGLPFWFAVTPIHPKHRPIRGLLQNLLEYLERFALHPLKRRNFLEMIPLETVGLPRWRHNHIARGSIPIEKSHLPDQRPRRHQVVIHMGGQFDGM